MTPQSIGRYQVFARLGAGGFATVYRAYDPRLDRDVAVKVLHPSHAADERMRERFLREGKALARVQHPNLVRLFDSGEADGIVYLTMEFIPGRSLAALAAEQAFDLVTVLPIVEQIAAALDALHDGGLLHRDIKPANVMLHEEGRAVLVDLGVAGLADAAGPTTRSMILGTPGFLAPEQVTGGARADTRTDVYQLAATVYTLLAGRPPFQGETARVLYAVAHETPPALHALCPDLPERACAVIDGALAKDPEQRPARAGEFAARLADALLAPTLLLPVETITDRATAAGEELAPSRAVSLPPPAPPLPIPPLPVAARPAPSRRRALVAAAAGAALVLFGGGAAIVGTVRGDAAGAAPAVTPVAPRQTVPAAEAGRDGEERSRAPRPDTGSRAPETVTTGRTPGAGGGNTPRTATPSAAHPAKPSPGPSSAPSPSPSARPSGAPGPSPSPNPGWEATPTPTPRPSSGPSAEPAPTARPAPPVRGEAGTTKQ